VFKRENEFDDLILTNSQKYGVPVWVIKATIGKESSFDPGAYVPGDESRGLMQLLPSTAKELGLRGDPGDVTTKTGGLFEPALNIQLGTKYLGKQAARYSAEPWDAIYAAYNAGRILRDAAGLFVNEAHVSGWRRIADYFNPGWRGDTPFRRAPGVAKKPPGR
jgi:soluble lytic murein transglycosylase-like protein